MKFNLLLRLILVVIGSSVAVPASARAAPPAKLNVLFVPIDDMGYADLGYLNGDGG